jgi:hypothetical protein
VFPKEPPNESHFFRNRFGDGKWFNLRRNTNIMEQRREILECLSELRNTYDDFQGRQIPYCRLRSLLTDLRKKAMLDRKNFFLDDKVS